jgi:hypothetical protein
MGAVESGMLKINTAWVNIIANRCRRAGEGEEEGMYYVAQRLNQSSTNSICG